MQFSCPATWNKENIEEKQLSEDEFKGTYEVVNQHKPLGNGSFGIVYEGRKKTVGNVSDDNITKCAIKTIELKQDKKERETVLREKKCLYRLQHKNVVEFFHFVVIKEGGVFSKGS